MSSPEPSLIVVGASTRAAAFSALRSGLRPWCVDLFGDVDLRRLCPVQVVAPHLWPDGILDLVRHGPHAPIVYTGAMENRPSLLSRLAEIRPLWGNDARVLAEVRTPSRLIEILRNADLPHAALHPTSGRRLVKPRAGAGGHGIRYWDGTPLSRADRRTHYLQDYIEGDAGAAVYLGCDGNARLLGITRQLVGESWCHARPFHYCGSVGLWQVAHSTLSTLELIGMTLGRIGLRGLFGVDFILRDDVPVPVEVNPRFTASVEVLEHAVGLHAMALHRSAFEPMQASSGNASGEVVGKAVWFAPHSVVVPDSGPWTESLDVGSFGFPNFADIPPAGQMIDAGRPVLTILCRAKTLESCIENLRATSRSLDGILTGA